MSVLPYFQLKRDGRLSNPIQIYHFAVEGEYTEGKPIDPAVVPKHQVAYFTYTPQTELCHVLFQPTLLIENSIQRVWRLYEPKLKWKGVQVFADDPEVSVSPMYWCPLLERVSCLDQRTEYYPDGTVKRPVLRLSALQGRHVVRAAGPVEPIVFLSLPVAESMLKRSAFGFQLEPVELV